MNKIIKNWLLKMSKLLGKYDRVVTKIIKNKKQNSEPDPFLIAKLTLVQQELKSHIDDYRIEQTK